MHCRRRRSPLRSGFSRICGRGCGPRSGRKMTGTRTGGTAPDGEFVAAPVSWWLGGDDGGNQLAAGRWLRAGQGGGLAVGPALVGAGGGVIEGRGAHGDGDRGDRGGGVGSLVAVVEVAGGGAFDLAGAVPGPADRKST